MKRFYLIISLLTGFISGNPVFAVNVETTNAPQLSLGLEAMTLNDFIALDVDQYRTSDGKKLKWTHRLGFKIAQKSYARGVKKGKLDGDANFYEAAKAANPANRTGRLSLIFAAAGLVFMLIPVGGMALIGLGLTIAGLVLGISGLRRDEDNTMALIGTVVSSVTLLLFLILILAAVAWLARFG